MMCLEQREITLCFVTILTCITKFLQGSMHTNTLGEVDNFLCHVVKDLSLMLQLLKS